MRRLWRQPHLQRRLRRERSTDPRGSPKRFLSVALSSTWRPVSSRRYTRFRRTLPPKDPPPRMERLAEGAAGSEYLRFGSCPTKRFGYGRVQIRKRLAIRKANMLSGIFRLVNAAREQKGKIIVTVTITEPTAVNQNARIQQAALSGAHRIEFLH